MVNRSIIDEPTRKKNRLSSKMPHPHQAYWCGACDRDKHHQGEKCRTCGNVEGVRTLKKGELP